jgi:hypothetical protein
MKSANHDTKISLAVLISMCIIILVYTWTITSRSMTAWPITTSYYDMLTGAFLHGQTHLLITPDQRLLELSDPYDPLANMHYRLHDALLYRGQYYFYWGPVPALLLAPVKSIRNAVTVNETETWLNGVLHGRAKWVPNTVSISDAYLVFAFAIGVVGFSALLLLALWQRLFYESPWWSMIPGIIVAGLGAPMPYLLGRAGIYEGAIVAGQCFLLGGIYWAYIALQHGRFSSWRLFLASVFWGLAVGSRLSLLSVVPILALLLLWRIHREGNGKLLNRLNLRIVAALGAPLIAGAIALGLYNYDRFGSWSEFGVRYQLAGVHMARIIEKSNFFLTTSVWHNLFSYVLCPIVFTPDFPFISGRANINETEQAASIFLISPFVWFAFVAPMLLAARSQKTIYAHKSKQETREISWIVICLLCAVLFGIGPVLMVGVSTMRYLADMTPSLVILAMIGVWQSHRLLRHRPMGSRAWVFLVLTLTFASAVIGTLLGQSKP